MRPIWLLLLIPLCLLALPGAALGADDGPPERDIAFLGAGGTRLTGTLTVPVQPHRAKAPGVVLVAGSGPTDRDGNQGAALHTDLLKQIAQGLARHGIASLRYDKRGVGGSAMTATDQSHLAQFVAWENFVGDVIAAADALRGQTGVDPASVGLLGHSEGGLLALQAAGEMKQRPHVLVLVSTPGRPLDAIVQDQLVRILKMQGATPEQTTFYLDKNAAIVAAIKSRVSSPWTSPPDWRPCTRPTSESSTAPHLVLTHPGWRRRIPAPSW